MNWRDEETAQRIVSLDNAQGVAEDRPDVPNKRVDCIGGPINIGCFEPCVRHDVIPTLRRGHAVFMDNLSSH